MELAIWVCVLCLQASLLSHARECSGTTTHGEDCVSGQTTGGQYDDAELQRAMAPSDTLRRAAPSRRQESIAPMTNPLRLKRNLWRRGPTQHSNVPGAISVKGFPNTLIQTERSRRHLGPSGNKKRNVRKSRVGSYSLLSNNNPSAPLKVTRARRQVKGEPSRRGKSSRSGAYSILGDPETKGQNDRPKRSIQRRRAARKTVCSQ